ncbi:MAG: DUF4062 domain-containing protein [bacterium]
MSSTFRDMHAERDYLVKYVFPDIREWCERWKLHLVDVDLRWGATEEEMENGKVIDICLEQIDRSRPFFVCILGNRYGWVPKPDEVPNETRERYDRLQGKEDYSMTHLEIHHAVLEPLRSMDNLEDIPHAFFYFRDKVCLPAPETIEGWSDDERNEYQEAFFDEDPSYSDRLAKLKDKIQEHYENLGKQRNNPNEVKERTFNYKPKFDPNLLNPEDDNLKGRFTRESLRELGERVKEDLKKTISLQFQQRIATLSEKREEDTLETELDYHESFVENRTQLFIGRTELLAKLRDYVDSDSREILAVYGTPGCGKSALLAKFYRDLIEEQSKILLIPYFVGASPGSSALHSLLRRMCEEIFSKAGLKEHKETCLSEVCGQGEEAHKQREAIEKEYEIPFNVNKLSNTFKSFLEKTVRKTIILMDGFNQLDATNSAHELNWLPNQLPGNVKIIASTLEGKAKEALKNKTKSELEVTPLTDGERREIIQEMPSVFCKTLAEEHIQALLEKEETRNPLYLRVALEELRMYGGFGKRGEKLREYIATFPSDVVEMFVFMLDRLERDLEEEREDQRTCGIVGRVFCLLECSRYGLTIRELRELMGSIYERDTHQLILRQIRDYLQDRGGLIDFFHPVLSKAVRKNYLSNGEATEWHRELAEYFQTQPLYIEEGSDKARPRSRALEGEGDKIANIRKLVEQPKQQTDGGIWKGLKETLTELDFVYAKCQAGMAYDLIDDYAHAEFMWPGQEEKRKEEESRIKRIKTYIEEVTAYAKAWNNARDRHNIDPSQLPYPGSNEIPNIEYPSLVKIKFLKAEETKYTRDEWTDQECIRGWRIFVNNHLSALIYGKIPAFQLAYNSADSSPVSEAIEKRFKQGEFSNNFWLRLINRPAFLSQPSCIRIFEGHKNWVNSIAITPDAKLCVSASLDRTLRVWDITTGQCLNILEGHTESVECLSLTPDGCLVISGSRDKTIRLWETKTGQCVKMLKGHKYAVLALTITPDGRRAVSAGDDKTIRVWDFQKGNCSHILRGDMRSVTSVALSLNGSQLLSNSKDRSLRLWNIDEKTYSDSVSLSPKNAYLIRAIAMTEDGRFGFAAEAQLIRVWDIKHRQYLGHLSTVHNGSGDLTSVAITPNGQRLIAGDTHGNIHLWILDPGHPETQLPLKTLSQVTGQIDTVAITPDGKWALSGSRDGSIRLWDLCGETKRQEPDMHGMINTLTIVPGEAKVISSGADTSIRLWDLHTAKCLRTFCGHSDAISDFDITSDEKILVSGSSDNTLRIWDIESGKCLKTLHGHTGTVNKVCITADGKRTISSSDDETLRFWDLSDGKELQVFYKHSGGITALVLTPDGRRAISGSYKKLSLNKPTANLFIWDLASQSPNFPLYWQFQTSNVEDLFVTSDGSYAVARGEGNIWARWDLKTTTCIEDTEKYNNIFLLPDGQHALVLKRDNTLWQRNLKTGDNLKRFTIQPPDLRILQFTQDGSYAISLASDTILHIWNLNDGKTALSYLSRSGPIQTIALHEPYLVVGTASGRIDFLYIENFASCRAPVVTPTRLWYFGEDTESGYWDEKLTARCHHCGIRFSISSESENKAREEDKKEAGAQKIVCPHCNNELVKNTVICDNRETLVYARQHIPSTITHLMSDISSRDAVKLKLPPGTTKIIKIKINCGKMVTEYTENGIINMFQKEPYDDDSDNS